MTKISALAVQTGSALAGGDLLPVVDISDVSMAPTGTDKRMTAAQFLAGLALIDPNAFSTGSGLPTGGVNGQVVTNTGTSGSGIWATPRYWPSGGTAGYVLTQQAGGVPIWAAAAAGNGLPPGGAPDQVLVNSAAGQGGWTALLTVANDFITAERQITAKVGVHSTGGFGGINFEGTAWGALDVNGASCLDLRGGRGTENAPQLNQNGDIVARVMFAGSTTDTGNKKVGVASINCVASQNWLVTGTPGNYANSQTGSRMEFWTNPNGQLTNHGELSMWLGTNLGRNHCLVLSGDLSVGGTSNLFGDVTTSGNISAVNLTATGTGSVSGAFSSGALTTVSATAGVFIVGAGGPQILTGAGAPTVGVAAPVGSLYLRTSGVTATTTLYVKTGSANTAWTAK